MGNCDGCDQRQPTRQITFQREETIDGLPGEMVFFVCDECTPEPEPAVMVVEFRFDADRDLEAMLI